MRCSVKDLLKNDGEIAEIGGTLEYEMLENNGDEIYFVAPISFSGELKNENGEILADGDVEFELYDSYTGNVNLFLLPFLLFIKDFGDVLTPTNGNL